MAHCSVESAGSTLRQNGWAGRISSKWRKTNFARGCSQRTFQKRDVTEIFMSSVEQNTGEQLTFLPEDSPANPSVQPGSEEARKMTVTSGRNILGSFGRSGPLGLLVKTLLESSTWHSTKLFLTWKTKATKSKRLLFQLAPSTPRTVGTESGLLHTPSVQEPGVSAERLQTKEGEPAKIGERAYDKHTGRLAQVGLHQQIAMLPTPRADDSKRGNYTYDQGDKTRPRLSLMGHVTMLPTPTDSMVTMQDFVQAKFHSSKRPKYSEAMLPTPKSRDWKGETQRGPEAPRDGLQNSLSAASGITKENRTGTQAGLRLRPSFVEFLMGFPENWTELPDSKLSAMQSCHKLRSKSLKQFKK